MTASGIELATFRFVAQHLNHCATYLTKMFQNSDCTSLRNTSICLKRNAFCFPTEGDPTLLPFFFHWHYSPLWSLACRTMSFHFFLSATNSLHLLTPSTWRPLSASSFHLFLGLPLLLVPSSSWVKIFLGILFSSILSRWPNQLTLCPFIHFTIFPPLLVSSSSRFVRLFHSPFSYLGPYTLFKYFFFFVNIHSSAPHDTTGLISVLYNVILVALDKRRLLKRTAFIRVR